MISLSDQSKIWIYQSDHHLSDAEQAEIGMSLGTFCAQWIAHNQQLKSDFRILQNRFIVLIVDETHTNASGCSIDTSVAFLKTLGNRMGIDFFGRLSMAYMLNGAIETVSIHDLPQYFKEGRISENSMFFNCNLTEFRQLKNDFLVPLKDHWLMSRIPF